MLESLLAKDVAKSKLSESEKSEAIARITTTDHLPDLADADFYIEAVSENLELKQDLFRQLNEVIKLENAIVASNTSSISITKLAASYRRPDRFVGMHFMNPGKKDDIDTPNPFDYL